MADETNDLRDVFSSLSDKISAIETNFQSLADKISSVESNLSTFQQNVNRFVEAFDIGTDEASKESVQSFNAALSALKLDKIANAKSALDGFLSHVNTGFNEKDLRDKEVRDVVVKQNHDYVSQLNDNRVFRFALMMKAATGEDLNPDNLTQMAKAGLFKTVQPESK